MKMNKLLISVATAALMSPAAVLAAVTAVDGFNTITYDEDKKAFGASTELDFAHTTGAVTVGADIDFDLNVGKSNLEQAFFAWQANEDVTVIGGVINNPIGADAEDITTRDFVAHSAIFNILDYQTALEGNTVAGVAAAGHWVLLHLQRHI